MAKYLYLGLVQSEDVVTIGSSPFFSSFSENPITIWFRCFLTLYNQSTCIWTLHLEAQDHTSLILFQSRPCQQVLHQCVSCVGIIYGHFPINAVSYVVAIHLMQREWLLCPPFFFSFLFSARLPFSSLGLRHDPFTPNFQLLEINQVGVLGAPFNYSSSTSSQVR